jgi:hypothetical protein
MMKRIMRGSSERAAGCTNSSGRDVNTHEEPARIKSRRKNRAPGTNMRLRTFTRVQTQRRGSMRKLVLAGLLTAVAVPALAQTTIVEERYYVIQDPQTKRCTYVTERPTTGVVLDLGIFRTRAEAELGARRSKVCVYE